MTEGIPEKAGRELDVLVHRDVFGYCNCVQDPKWCMPETGSSVRVVGGVWCCTDHGRPVWSEPPRYSTDIAAAWEVVEKLGRDGFTCDFQWKGAGREYEFTAEVAFNRWRWSEGLQDFGHAVGSAPEAICRAALMACASSGTPSVAGAHIEKGGD